MAAAVSKKLVIVGNGICGKTALFERGKLNEAEDLCARLGFVPTIFESCERDIELYGRQVKLTMVDTGGHDNLDRFRPTLYRQTDVFLVCFAVDCRDDFENIEEKWIPEVKHHCPDVPIILVATKKDLRNDPATIEKLAKRNEKPLTTEDGEVMANRIGAAAYVECSAQTKEGVREVFEIATRHALGAKRKDRNRKCSIF